MTAGVIERNFTMISVADRQYCTVLTSQSQTPSAETGIRAPENPVACGAGTANDRHGRRAKPVTPPVSSPLQPSARPRYRLQPLFCMSLLERDLPVAGSHPMSVVRAGRHVGIGHGVRQGHRK
jgi:hypothetical protein